MKETYKRAKSLVKAWKESGTPTANRMGLLVAQETEVGWEVVEHLSRNDKVFIACSLAYEALGDGHPAVQHLRGELTKTKSLEDLVNTLKALEGDANG